ncbi:MAG: 30S ribosomal protein S18 [Planctomycetes bacterium]|nr:30S ribosomal protein S18 [Planctomycetota bacterium]
MAPESTDAGAAAPGKKKYRKFRKDNRCRFCREKITKIDYKDVQILQKLTTAQGKLFSRKRSGNCARHQRAVKRALKRAKYIALLPYTGGA